MRSALALDPEDAGAHHVLVDVLCDRKDGPGAVTAAESGLRLAPHDFTSHYQYARALLSLRRPRTRDAYEAALRAVEAAPHSPDAHNLVGLCLDALGNHEGAQAAFRNAMALDPQHTLAQNNLAASEMDRGRLGRAAGLLRGAVGSDPQQKQVRDNLDTVLLLLGRRVMWSLFAAAIVLGILLVTGAPWWSRALAGAAYVAVVVVLVRRRGPRPAAGRRALGSRAVPARAVAGQVPPRPARTAVGRRGRDGLRAVRRRRGRRDRPGRRPPHGRLHLCGRLGWSWRSSTSCAAADGSPRVGPWTSA